MDFLDYYDSPYAPSYDYGAYNAMPLPDTAGPAPSGGGIFDTVKAGASSLFNAYVDITKLQNQADATRIAADVEKARVAAAGQAQLSGVRIGQAMTAANESVELARARAIATNAAPKPSGMSQYLPLILLGVVGLVAWKLAK